MINGLMALRSADGGKWMRVKRASAALWYIMY